MAMNEYSARSRTRASLLNSVQSNTLDSFLVRSYSSLEDTIGVFWPQLTMRKKSFFDVEKNEKYVAM